MVQSGHPKTSAHLSAFEGEADMGRRIVPIIPAAFDPQRSLAAKFAVMHNTAQTAMMRLVEPGQGK